MEILDKKRLFNSNFKNFYSNKEHSHYINSLLNFALNENEIDEGIIESSMNVFSTEITKYILRNEKIKGVSTIDQNRKNTAEDIVYYVENYLLTLEPNEALEKILTGDIEKLILDSIEYSKNYKNEIINKINQIKKITDLEYNNNGNYSEQLNFLEFSLNGKTSFSGLTYSPMMGYRSQILNNESYLYMYDKYVSYFLDEANIINKFDLEARKYILRKINKNEGNILSDQQLDNICHAILTNYVLLSIYSDNPEKLVITSKNYDLLKKELLSGTIDEKELEECIINGPVKFSNEELKYIKDAFISSNIDENKKAYKTLFLHLAV